MVSGLRVNRAISRDRAPQSFASPTEKASATSGRTISANVVFDDSCRSISSSRSETATLNGDAAMPDEAAAGDDADEDELPLTVESCDAVASTHWPPSCPSSSEGTSGAWMALNASCSTEKMRIDASRPDDT